MSLKKTSPNPDNIVRGGSRLLIKFPGDAFKTHMGYIEGLKSTPNIKTDPKYNAIDGSEARIKLRTSMTSVTHSFTCAERSNRIVRAWFLGGDESTVPQASAVGETETIGDITGEVDGADVEIGAYYPLAKKLVSNPAWAGKVEGTDFAIEPKTGAIAFLRAVTTLELAESVTYDCEETATIRFTKFASLSQSISAEIVHTFEDGSIVDRDVIPLGNLVPDGDFGSGDDASETGKDASLAFKIEQNKHPTLGWGTFDTNDLG